MKTRLAVCAIALIAFLGLSCKDIPAETDLKAPPGFEANVYADWLGGARFMAFGPGDALYVALIDSGKVVALVDADSNGIAERRVESVTALERPNNIAFYEGRAYVGETTRITSFAVDPKTLRFSDRKVVVPDLPAGGHSTRTVAFGPDGKMYVSVGSSCNICEEKDERRAAILRFNADGSGQEVFARGLRNSVGLEFQPGTGSLFATDMGRDWLGDDLPPDEVNIIREGKHYGWPYCYSDRTVDPNYKDRAGFCRESSEPAYINLQAHSAPLGLMFYSGKMFPEKYRGRLFIAFHGSWNRTVPTGYKIVTVPFDGNDAAGRYEDFLTGFFRDGGKRGRPVDIVQAKDGSILISDDHGGRIWRVSYRHGK